MKAKTPTAARAQAARREAGYSPAEVAMKMRERGHDWSSATVVNVENGRRIRWETEEMVSLATVLNTTVGFLFPSLVEAGDASGSGTARYLLLEAA